MQQVLYIFRKEFGSYFISPVAYIVISIFLLGGFTIAVDWVFTVFFFRIKL